MTTSRGGKGDRSADGQYAKGRERRAPRSTNPPRAIQDGPIQAIVKSVEDNTLTCRILEGNDTDGRTEADFDFIVARPQEHRRDFYDGVTSASGWLGTYVSATQRTYTKAGSDTETHKITADYEPDVSIIEIGRVRTRDGMVKIGARFVYWIDNNTNSRVWAVEVA